MLQFAKVTKRIIILFVFLLCDRQSFATLEIYDANMSIDYEITTPRFETPPIPLRVGVLRFEDLRPADECNAIFSVRLNKGYTETLFKQLLKSNVFKEIKEVPLNILKKFEGCKLDKNIAQEIANEIKVEALLCGRIEKLKIDDMRIGVFLYKYTVESVFSATLINIDNWEGVWVDTFKRKIENDKGLNPFVGIDKIFLSSLIFGAIKETNEKIQKNIVDTLTNINTRNYSVEAYMPKIILKGNPKEEKNFIKLKENEIDKAGRFLATTVIVIEVIPTAVIFNMAWYYAYPLVALPSWFIANSIGQASVKKVIEEKRRNFFEEDTKTFKIETNTTINNTSVQSIGVRN